MCVRWGGGLQPDFGRLICDSGRFEFRRLSCSLSVYILFLLRKTDKQTLSTADPFSSFSETSGHTRRLMQRGPFTPNKTLRWRDGALADV
jgi:hypothetical protein